MIRAIVDIVDFEWLVWVFGFRGLRFVGCSYVLEIRVNFGVIKFGELVCEFGLS